MYGAWQQREGCRWRKPDGMCGMRFCGSMPKIGQARKTACVMAAGVKPWSRQAAVRRRLPGATIYFVLTDDREKLYARIEDRIDEMMSQGLVDEVRQLKDMGCRKGMTSMQGLGYKEILEYLEKRHIAYCEDSTNRENEYTRNRLRNELIPQIRREINEKAVEHIVEAGERLPDAYFEEQAEKIWRECGVTKKCHAEGDVTGLADRTKSGAESQVETADEIIYGMERSVLLKEPPIVRTYVLRHMISMATQSLKDITSDHIDQVTSLLEKETGKRINLPYGLTAWTEYEFLWISKWNPAGHVDNQPSISLIMKKIPYEKAQEIPQNRYTKWFDYDRIKGTLTVRTRQTGDYITLKDGRKKTVKAYMIDEKIPRELRDRVTLLAEDHHVLWIVGWRISEYYKVTEDTDYVLEVQADGGRENG